MKFKQISATTFYSPALMLLFFNGECHKQPYNSGDILIPLQINIAIHAVLNPRFKTAIHNIEFS